MIHYKVGEHKIYFKSKFEGKTLKSSGNNVKVYSHGAVFHLYVYDYEDFFLFDYWSFLFTFNRFEDLYMKEQANLNRTKFIK